MTIDDRIAELKAELERLEAEKAKVEACDLKPGEWVLYWDNDDSPRLGMLESIYPLIEEFPFKIKDAGSYVRARRPTLDDWRRMGAPVAEPRKTDWSKAPAWAKYQAVDAKGAAHFYEGAPEQGKFEWLDCCGGMRCKADVLACPDWKDTLETRPGLEEEE